MRHASFSLGPFTSTPCVKLLVLSNAIIWFFLVLIVQQFFLSPHYSIFHWFGLVPNQVMSQLFLWQPLTYMFLHSQGIFHILFNLLILWMFGSDLERLWGSRFFLSYYMACGVGAAFIYITVLTLVSLVSPESAATLLNVPVVGSSGAIFGLMAAYGVMFKDRIIFFMMIFPMKARTFTYLIIGIELLSMLSEGFGGPVANLAHLGGLLSGFLFLILWKHWSKLKESVFRHRRWNKKLHIVHSNEDTRHRKIWH